LLGDAAFLVWLACLEINHHPWFYCRAGPFPKKKKKKKKEEEKDSSMTSIENSVFENVICVGEVIFRLGFTKKYLDGGLRDLESNALEFIETSS
jgi:hypothetical protein